MSAGATLQRAHVFQPATQQGRAPLLLLHGTGDDERGLLGLGAALSPGAALLSPRGMVLEGASNRFFRRLGEGVFDEEDLRVRADELASFVQAASGWYGLEPGALYAVGFSNGANAAGALLLTHPELLAGAVLIASVPPFTDPPQADLSGRRVLVSNGENDVMARPDQTAALADQLSKRRADVRVLTHPGGHQLVPDHLPVMQALLQAR